MRLDCAFQTIPEPVSDDCDAYEQHRPEQSLDHSCYRTLTITMIVAGSLIATVYDSEPTSGNQVMNIGAAAPAIIGALAAEPRDSEGGTRKFDGSTPLQSRLRQFLAFG